MIAGKNMVEIVLYAVIVIFVSSCSGGSDDSTPLDIPASGDVSDREGVSGEVRPDDARLDDMFDFGRGTDWTGGDWEPFEDEGDGLGKLGDPCEGNSDCESGYCVPSDIGYLCTVVCFDDCPEGWKCKGVDGMGPDVLFVCMPGLDMVCEKSGVCEPGEEESGPCGNCGLRTRTCGNDCQWGFWSNCSGEGECKPDSTMEEWCDPCGIKTKTCSDDCIWSAWSECSGGAECASGEMDTVACGNCGEQFRMCTDECIWSEWSPCQSEGDCAPGEDEVVECGNCGTTLSICDDNCQWSDFGECTGEGPCTPGESDTMDCGKCGKQTRQCTDGCMWNAWGTCAGEGACFPGDVKKQDCGKCGQQETTCTGQCKWGPPGECVGVGQCEPGTTQPCNNCGTETCTPGCTWGDCELGLIDAYEENDTKDKSHSLPGITDVEGSGQTVWANINPDHDEDWFVVHIADVVFHEIKPTFKLSDVPAGHMYELCISYLCDKSDETYEECKDIAGGGSISFVADFCTIWGILGDNSGEAHIQIKPLTPGTCDNYTLQVDA